MNGKQARKLRKLSGHKVGAREHKGKTHGVREKIFKVPVRVNNKIVNLPAKLKYQAITIVNLAKQKYKIAKLTYRRLRNTWNA